MDYDFKDKTVIITGGSEGVGAATARKFAEHGANLVLVARSKRNLDRIAEELRGKTRVEVIAMDVSDTDACVNLFKKAEFEFGNINILVNNAGYHERGPVESVSVEDLGAMIDVNLKAPIILCKLAIKYLKQAGGGAIINVASLAGRTPVPRAATYSATKFGLRAFTFALGEELRGSDIKLAAVSPGPIDTGFIMSNIDDVTDITFSQPMSTADEVAQEILNLTANKKRERSMPPISGLLTTTMYLFPWLGRLVLPLMIRKGRIVKRKLKARMRQIEEKQGG
ncbi:MAG: SDR family NAD(P)-dependent oxidoreductase [Proteobacteria bacterium]|nr:SDR family NAD(P)-dependent oxidoreductase [Pseudomonadota bacterium]